LKWKEQDLYGSSRLGMAKPEREVTGFFWQNASYTLVAGAKSYELSNHLGNVMAVISDRGELQSAQDFYPFGMAMPGRSTGSYKYRFNGKETDPETGIQDYGMRWYLPNIARFPSVDPITKQYPELTPYQFASNSPITGIDRDGLEFFFAGGAGNDMNPLTKNGYINEIISAFKTASISNVIRLNVHGGQFDDINFTLGPNGRTPCNQKTEPSNYSYPPSDSPLHSEPYEDAKPAIQPSIDFRIQTAEQQIKDQRIKGAQLNLAGYSTGSVVVAQTALLLADQDVKIDNLILIGSPIDANSVLGKTLSKYVQEGKIGKIIHIASVGDEVLGLASCSPEEQKTVKTQIGMDIVSGNAYKMSEGKIGSPKEVIHLRIAGDKDDPKANKTRAEVAQGIKAEGIE
jgi:RHS repeat-associated protein